MPLTFTEATVICCF